VDDADAGRPDPTDVTMARGWGLDVDIRGEGDGAPIEGAQVVAGGRSATTDAEGHAALENLTGASVTVAVRAASYGPRQSKVSAPSSGDRAELRLRLSQGGSIAGRITDYRGDPVPGARITVVPAADADAAPHVTHADVDGRWTVDGLPEGDYEVDATPPSARDEELAPDAQKTDVLRGHVTRGVQLRSDRR
ncbi:MAG: carboxypeptidase-like regulatory domain-containing protein, partial [Myxococcota bacterium]